MNGHERTLVEQARARGLSVEESAARLTLDPADVAKAWEVMDEAVSEDDDPPHRWPRYDARLEQERVAVVAAAAKVRARHTILEMIAIDPRGETCGSHAAYTQHHRRWEPIDALCLVAERKHRRELRRRQRAAARARAA